MSTRDKRGKHTPPATAPVSRRRARRRPGGAVVALVSQGFGTVIARLMIKRHHIETFQMRRSENHAFGERLAAVRLYKAL